MAFLISIITGLCFLTKRNTSAADNEQGLKLKFSILKIQELFRDIDLTNDKWLYKSTHLPASPTGDGELSSLACCQSPPKAVCTDLCSVCAAVGSGVSAEPCSVHMYYRTASLASVCSIVRIQQYINTHAVTHNVSVYTLYAQSSLFHTHLLPCPHNLAEQHWEPAEKESK